jgi:cyclomaltodextrinase
MLKEAVYHKMCSDYAYAISKEDLLIKLRTKKDDLKNVNLIYIDKYKYHINKEIITTVMKKVASDKLFDYYEAVIQHNFISVNYFFELMDGTETLY